MKKVKWDPKLPTLNGFGRMTVPNTITIQAQIDQLIKDAAGTHAVVEMVAETKITQTYQLDDGSRLKINLRTMAVTRL